MSMFDNEVLITMARLYEATADYWDSISVAIALQLDERIMAEADEADEVDA